MTRNAAVRLGVQSLSRGDLHQLDGILRREDVPWSQLCVRAGLEAPVRTPSIGLQAEQALEIFVEQMQALPASTRHLRDWCRHRGIATAR